MKLKSTGCPFPAFISPFRVLTITHTKQTHLICPLSNLCFQIARNVATQLNQGVVYVDMFVDTAGCKARVGTFRQSDILLFFFSRLCHLLLTILDEKLLQKYA